MAKKSKAKKLSKTTKTPASQFTMTNEDIACKVDSEGLDYAITSYMGSEDFIDRELAGWWDEAKKYLDLITERLQESGLGEN